MTHIRIKTATKKRLKHLADQLVGTPGVETANYAGTPFVPVDQVLALALAALERELGAKKGPKK